DLEDLTTLPADVPIDVADALAGAAAAIDEAQGAGAKDIVQRATVNIGVIHGGQKVNMVPGTCWFEADIRLPPGVGKDAVTARVLAIVARYPEAMMEAINFSEPSVCAQPRGSRSSPRSPAAAIQTMRWCASSAPTPGGWAGPSPPPSSASEAPMRGCGASAASPGSFTARSPAAWHRPTNTSRSRSTCTSSACTCCRPSTTSQSDLTRENLLAPITSRDSLEFPAQLCKPSLLSDALLTP